MDGISAPLRTNTASNGGPRWGRGLLRVWLVAAVLWSIGVAASQYSQFTDYYLSLHSLCIRHSKDEPFDSCWRGMQSSIEGVRETHIYAWALFSVVVPLLVLLIGWFAIKTGRWVRAGFRPDRW